MKDVGITQTGPRSARAGVRAPDKHPWRGGRVDTGIEGAGEDGDVFERLLDCVVGEIVAEL